MYQVQELRPISIAAHKQIQSSAKVTFDEHWSLMMIHEEGSFEVLVKGKHSFASENEVPESDLKIFLGVRN